MKHVFTQWLSGWRALTFQEKHSVVFSLAGVAATVAFGGLAAVLGWTQFSVAENAAKEQRVREIRERNQRELEQAVQWFSGPHSDDHDDIIRMLEDHVLEHVEEKSGLLGR
jgi:hypothetical protein